MHEKTYAKLVSLRRDPPYPYKWDNGINIDRWGDVTLEPEYWLAVRGEFDQAGTDAINAAEESTAIYWHGLDLAALIYAAVIAIRANPEDDDPDSTLVTFSEALRTVDSDPFDPDVAKRAIAALCQAWIDPDLVSNLYGDKSNPRGRLIPGTLFDSNETESAGLLTFYYFEYDGDPYTVAMLTGGAIVALQSGSGIIDGAEWWDLNPAELHCRHCDRYWDHGYDGYHFCDQLGQRFPDRAITTNELEIGRVTARVARQQAESDRFIVRDLKSGVRLYCPHCGGRLAVYTTRSI